MIEEITEITRSIEVSFADLRPEHLKMIEEGSAAVGTVAAVASASAQKVVEFGSFSSLTRYRFAFIAKRPLAAGEVIESPAATRRPLLHGRRLPGPDVR